MPYIRRDERVDLGEYELRQLALLDKLSPGQMNFIISSLVWSWFDQRPSYTRANELIGIIEAVKQEFYRRKVAPYEDAKKKENGDV